MRMLHDAAACAAGFVTFSAALAAPQPPGPRQPGASITGTVEDSAGGPLANVTVIMLDASTGLPLLRDTYESFGTNPDAAEREMPGDSPQYATAVTDGAGRFTFAGVPAGEIRLLAQSWAWSDEAHRVRPPKPGEDRQVDEPATSLFAVNGDIIHLRGISSDIVVDPAAPDPVDLTLRPLGDGTLVIDTGAGNDETLLVLSTSPTSADPVLGFTGWTGPFLQFAIGLNRMPSGETTVRGLPPRPIYLAVFSADNNPGWGAGAVEVPAGGTIKAEVPFVASWSDGVHSPPPRLEPLARELREAGITTPNAAMQLLANAGFDIPRPEARGPSAMVTAMAELGRQVTTPVKLPSGQEVPAGDFLAAAAYIAMADRLQQAGRPVNPWKGIDVRTP